MIALRVGKNNILSALDSESYLCPTAKSYITPPIAVALKTQPLFIITLLLPPGMPQARSHGLASDY